MTWKRVRAAAQIVIGVLALAFLVWALARNWGATITTLATMNGGLVLLAAALVGVGLYLNMLSWRAVLAAMGVRLSRREAGSVFFTAQIGKYIPGGVWPILVSSRLGQAFGVTAAVSMTSMTVALLMSVTVGASFALGALLLVPVVIERYAVVPILLVLLGLVALLPPVMNRMLALAFRLLRRGVTLPPLDTGWLGRAALWSVTSWACLGGALSTLVAAAGVHAPGQLLAAVPAYALSWVVGFAAVLVPAGVGVREAVLALALSGGLGASSVLGIAVVHRVLMTLGDVGMLVLTGRTRRALETHPDVEVTFVSRKFPPSVGGMETLAANTARALAGQYSGAVRVWALGRSNRHLLWWLPATALRLVWSVLARPRSAYLFGDALCWAALGWIPRLAGRAALTEVMGLDVTFENRLYRAIVLPALRRAPRVLAISSATRQAVIDVGVPAQQVEVTVLGLPAVAHAAVPSRAEARVLVRRRHGIGEGDIVLVTTGRLVPRKGVRWFVDTVLPGLDERYHHLVLGSGPDESAIRAAAAERGVSERLHLLGHVSDEERDLVIRGGDLFVQPNIPVPHDMEGFGLVVVEAAQAGLLTVAARLEGLVDAVIDGETGIAVPSGDAAAWRRAVRDAAERPDRVEIAARFAVAARSRFSLDAMGVQLRAQIEAVRAISVRAREARSPRGRARP
ncbi:MAG: glycosyltransferase [Microbacteriaceae bacterium]